MIYNKSDLARPYSNILYYKFSSADSAFRKNYKLLQFSDSQKLLDAASLLISCSSTCVDSKTSTQLLLQQGTRWQNQKITVKIMIMLSMKSKIHFALRALVCIDLQMNHLVNGSA